MTWTIPKRLSVAILATSGLMALAIPQAASAQDNNSCAAGIPIEYNGYINTSRYNYYIIRSSLPASTRTGQDRAIARIRAGMRTWNEARNSCGYGRYRTFTTAFSGDSGSSYTDHSDSKSTIDFGATFDCKGSTVIACNTKRSTGRNLRMRRVIREADIRFRSPTSNGPYFYTGVGRPRCGPECYDLWSTAAHEVGHTVGIADHYDEVHRWQTMYGIIENSRQQSPTRKRSLGRMDYVGLRYIYNGLAPPD